MSSKKHGVDVSAKPRALQKLQAAAVQAKHGLSFQYNVSMHGGSLSIILTGRLLRCRAVWPEWG